VGTLRRELETANAKWEKLYAAKDWPGLGGLYTTDSEVLPSGAPIQRGRDAIGRFFEAPSKMGIARIELKIQEVGYVDCDSAYERSRAFFYTAEGKVADKIKYLVIWKRVSGVWHLHRDIFNSDGPQTDAAVEIKAANDKWMAAFTSKNAEGIAALYTPEARFLHPGHEMVTGRAAIQKAFTGLMASTVAAAILGVDAEVHRGSGDDSIAYERAGYVFKAADGTVLDEGKYLVIWKRVGGQWFLDQDIFNSNRS